MKERGDTAIGSWRRWSTAVALLVSMGVSVSAAQLNLGSRTKGFFAHQAGLIGGPVAPPPLQPNPGPALPPLIDECRITHKSK